MDNQKNDLTQDELTALLNERTQQMHQWNGMDVVSIKAKGDIGNEVGPLLKEEKAFLDWVRLTGTKKSSLYNYMDAATLLTGYDEALAKLQTRTPLTVLYEISRIKDEVVRNTWRDRYLAGEYITKAILPPKEKQIGAPKPVVDQLREFHGAIPKLVKEVSDLLAKVDPDSPEYLDVHSEYMKLAAGLNKAYEEMVAKAKSFNPQHGVQSPLEPAQQAPGDTPELSEVAAKTIDDEPVEVDAASTEWAQQTENEVLAEETTTTAGEQKVFPSTKPAHNIYKALIGEIEVTAQQPKLKSAMPAITLNPNDQNLSLFQQVLLEANAKKLDDFVDMDEAV